MVSKAMTPDERAKVFKALADPRRVEIVELLAQGSQCGSVLAESLGVSMALLCHHWEVLVDAGILKKERVGQLRVCSLDSARLREALSMGAALQEPQASRVAKETRAKIAETPGKQPAKAAARTQAKHRAPVKHREQAKRRVDASAVDASAINRAKRAVPKSTRTAR
jgi:DNA-binding transcriptional ArsR family regulator